VETCRRSSPSRCRINRSRGDPVLDLGDGAPLLPCGRPRLPIKGPAGGARQRRAPLERAAAVQKSLREPPALTPSALTSAMNSRDESPTGKATTTVQRVVGRSSRDRSRVHPGCRLASRYHPWNWTGPRRGRVVATFAQPPQSAASSRVDAARSGGDAVTRVVQISVLKVHEYARAEARFRFFRRLLMVARPCRLPRASITEQNSRRKYSTSGVTGTVSGSTSSDRGSRSRTG
jgi:hypothetical protein